jgi:multiple sugar transport system ATP-binding protein
MRKGELQQVADPQTLYDDPVNLFVAGFIGSPAMNMLEATVGRDNGSLYVQAGSGRITLDNDTLAQHPAIQAYVGRDVVLGIRPEDLEDRSLAGATEQGAQLHGTVTLRESLGSEVVVHFSVDARPAVTQDVMELVEDTGEDRAPDERTDEGKTVIVGRFGARSRVRPGEDIQVAVDTRQMHFFDPETGLGIYHDVPEPAAAAAPA